MFNLASSHEHSEDIKKSKFLVWAQPVATSEQALDFFQNIASLHPTANHHCWAYRIGQNIRFNDDGEPGGTAGRPILQAIMGADLDQTAVLVVRYFGGIKLGTGGLIRAYGGSAARCLHLATKVEVIAQSQRWCVVDFALQALVRSRFATYEIHILAEKFLPHGVCWQLQMPTTQVEEFSLWLQNASKGKAYCASDEPDN